MRNRPGTALFVLTSLTVFGALSACSVYFGDDDDDCLDYGDGAIAPVGLRNPDTGACEYLGGPGGGCGEDVPAYADLEADSRAPLPDWGECPSECESLNENQCVVAERCRAIYLDYPCPPDTVCDPAPRAYYGCWSIAPSGPANERVACESLDSYECSRHNDCAGVYTDTYWVGLEAPPLRFLSCAAENFQGCYGDSECPAGWNCTADVECLPPPGCDPMSGEECPPVCYGRCEPPPGSCAAIDCAPGWHCEETCLGCGANDSNEADCDPMCRGECVPDQNVCPITCPPDSQCVEVCNDGGGGGGWDDGWGAPEPVCSWQCVPVGATCASVTCPMGQTCEIQCNAAGECRPVCVPETGGVCAAVDCGPGYHCEERCANGQCMPACVANQDPGACTGDVLCDSLPPSCPSGTVPGIRDGCWTGYCIPESACGLMTPNP